MDALTRERFAPGTVPACPHCGHQSPGMVRYRLIRSHSERRIRPDGRVYDTRKPCPGTGMHPEWVTP